MARLALERGGMSGSGWSYRGVQAASNPIWLSLPPRMPKVGASRCQIAIRRLR